MKSPCFNCTRRSQICHAQCEAYHMWAADMRKNHDNARKNSEGAAYAKENRERIRRRKNLR